MTTDAPGIRYTGHNIAEILAALQSPRAAATAPAVRAHPHGPYPVAYPPDVTAEVWNDDKQQWQPLRPGDTVTRTPGGSLTAVTRPAESPTKIES
ncbi:hypothetical protein [Nocardia salmonicida]|uniref:hypothetical protein n=1 Tax=Nocardia salmonicida TaxID=53431 RepID=UPI003625FE4F